jgi:hypothetical protein
MKPKLKFHKCSGYRTSGYWKGYPCGAVAHYQKDGKWWCKNHLPICDLTKIEEHFKKRIGELENEN